jgi:hypothetical protein
MNNKLIPLFILRKMQKNTTEKLQKISEEIDERECHDEMEWRNGAANLFIRWVKQKRFIKSNNPIRDYNGRSYTMDNYSVPIPMIDRKNKKLLKEKFPDILNYIDNRFGEKSTILLYWITLMECKNQRTDKKIYAIVVRLAAVKHE